MSALPLVVRVDDAGDLRLLFERLGLAGARFIVKPNWFCLYPGNYTTAQALDLTLAALPGPAVVVESYTAMRHDGSREITSRNGREDWAWLREQDAWFMEISGIGEVLRRHGAEYINVTEEVWSGRAVPAAEVAARVEARYGGIDQPELYGYVPQRLFEWAGNPLISLARLKGGWSLSLKNLFGLIPDPLRSRWHGPKDADLARSIININLVYHALFAVFGLVEALTPFALYGEGGEYHTPWGNYELRPEAGVVFAGASLPAVDALVARACGIDPAGLEYLQLAEARLGPWREGLGVEVPTEVLTALRPPAQG